MIIRGTGHGFKLEDPENFRALKLILPFPEPAAESDLPDHTKALGGWNGLSHVFVEADKLRALAGENASNPTWEANFVAMLEYADTSGWIDADRRIRIHVDYIS